MAIFRPGRYNARPMLVPSLPDGMTFACVSLKEADIRSLHERERIFAEKISSPLRQREFIAGRMAAARALRSLKAPADEAYVLRNGRAPQWPAGFTGSISHSREYAAACAALRTGFKAVGIDLENTARSVRPGIAARILTPFEREWVLEGTGANEKLLRVFSAKECIFKMLAPLTGTSLFFRDAELREDGPGCLRAKILNGRFDRELLIHWTERDGHLLTYSFMQ